MQKIPYLLNMLIAMRGASLFDFLVAPRTDNDAQLGAAQAASDSLNALADWAAALGVELKTESENTR
jgi:hypothetical protein